MISGGTTPEIFWSENVSLRSFKFSSVAGFGEKELGLQGDEQ